MSYSSVILVTLPERGRCQVCAVCRRWMHKAGVERMRGVLRSIPFEITFFPRSDKTFMKGFTTRHENTIFRGGVVGSYPRWMITQLFRLKCIISIKPVE